MRGSRIIKAADEEAKVLPCAYGNLPRLGEKERFWDLARGYYDIHNLHIYTDWGYLRTDTSAYREERRARAFRALMLEHDEGAKQFWITETGWWGSSALTSHMFDLYKKDPQTRTEFRMCYTGHEILTHPVVLREDALRAEWMVDLYPRLLAVPGCDKVFLWVSLDEFENGYDPNRLYGRSTPDRQASQIDLWGIVAGDKSWRKSAYALQEMMRQ